jgi:hypothetical protein
MNPAPEQVQSSASKEMGAVCQILQLERKAWREDPADCEEEPDPILSSDHAFTNRTNISESLISLK